MLHLGYLNYTQYRVKVSFGGLENITYDLRVKFVVSSSVGFPARRTEMSFHLSHLLLSSGLTLVSVENVQPDLFPSGDLVPFCLRRADFYGDGKKSNRVQDLTGPVVDLLKGLTLSPFYFPVYVCTLSEEVLHERLGNRAEVDVHPATAAAPLQR